MGVYCFKVLKQACRSYRLFNVDTPEATRLRFWVLLTLLPLVALAGCSEVEGPTTLRLEEGPVSTLTLAFDATPFCRSGEFFFLPPLAEDPSDQAEYDVGSFDTNRDPEVEICEWAGGCVSQVALFTTLQGSGSETVRLADDAEHYIVNFNTRLYDLDLGKFYRILVRDSGVLLGSAAVMLVSTADELQTIPPEYVGIVDGETLPIKFRIEADAMLWRIATPEGGTLAFPGDIEFTIPPEAVDQCVAIRLIDLDALALQSLMDKRPYYSSAKTVLAGFMAEPDGLRFNKPIRARLPVQPPAGVPVQVEMDPEAQQYWIEPTYLTYDPNTGVAEITLTHFSGHSVVSLDGLEVQPPPECIGNLYVVQFEGDFATETGCQVLVSSVTVTFLCEPPITHKMQVSETTPECGDDFSLTIDVTPETVAECRNTTLQTTIRDQNDRLFDVPLMWNSLAPLTAPVHPAFGIVTGMAVGQAVIEATTPDPRFGDSATVTVESAPPIDIRPFEADLLVGETVALVGLDEEGSDYLCEERSGDGIDTEMIPITWSSSDPSVATIDPASGLVTAVSAGSTRITASSGAAQAQISVRVAEEEEPVEDCDFSDVLLFVDIKPTGWPDGFLGRYGERDASKTLEPGWTLPLEARVESWSSEAGWGPAPTCLTDDWVWSSGNPSIATVATTTGVVSAVGLGRVNIYVEHALYPDLLNGYQSVNVVSSWLDRDSDGTPEYEYQIGAYGCVVGSSSEGAFCEPPTLGGPYEELFHSVCPGAYVEPGQGYSCSATQNPYTDPRSDCEVRSLNSSATAEELCVGTVVEAREEWYPMDVGGCGSYFCMDVKFRDEGTMQGWWW